MICLKTKIVELKKDPTPAIVIICALLLARTALEIFSYTLFSSV